MSETVKFEKIVPEGKALAHWDGKALFVTGPLPGETAKVKVTRNKSKWAEGVMETLEDTSPRRQKARETHFMSCSPWQGVEYDYQLELKRAMLSEVFARPELALTVADVKAAPRQFEYRNKLEFALRPTASGKLELAFHQRGSVSDLVAAPHGCALGSEAMNTAALRVLERANQLELGDMAAKLIVRQSHTHGHVIVVLEVKARMQCDWLHLAVPEAAGVTVVWRNKSGIYQTLWSRGSLELAETLGSCELFYPWEAFFQVNVPAFEMALEQILSHIVPDTKVVDLYGGAGTIGLPVARVAREVVGIEVVAEAVKLANANAKANKLANYRAVAAPAEQVAPDLLAEADTVIVDPPRAGLHDRVIDLLLEAKPRQIIYLSCNPATQARDIISLKADYAASEVTGFDFYPGTLHLESLVVLTRR